MTDLEERLDRLDLSLFAGIGSQTTDNDRSSLLACQRATRRLRGSYRYLEIGSHLGGSIQPHLVDPACERVWSIDKRPLSQPDERGGSYRYRGNSTARMLELLAGVGPVDKVVTIDGSTTEIDPAEITEPIDLAFIDGEHTDAAAVADFGFCRRVLGDRGAIVFHDAAITYGAIAACLAEVEHLEPVAYVLPDMVFVVELGGFPLHEDPYIAHALLHNHVPYLYALELNDEFRAFARKPILRHLRRAADLVQRRLGTRDTER